MMPTREVALSIFFTIITCGLYGIYWFICLTDELNQATGEADTGGGMAFLFNLITCGIYGIYWSYKMGEKLNRARRLYNMPVNDNSVLYLILSIFGLDIIVWALLQHELNKLA